MFSNLSRGVALATAATLTSVSALAQDECTSATVLALGANGPFDSTGSTVSTPAWSCGLVTGGDVWYEFTTPAGPAGELTIDTFGSTIDTVLEVWDSCGGTVLDCNDDFNPPVRDSLVTVIVSGGTTVYARVGGFSTSVGDHNVNVAFVTPDECAGAITIVDGVNGPMDNTGATDSLPVFSCSTSNSDIWFVHTASCDGMLTVTTDTAGPGSITDTVMEAWDMCGGTVLACDDDGGPGTYSEVTIPVTAGVDYYFRVGDFGTTVNQGLFNITVLNMAAPTAFNDECPCAAVVVDGVNTGLDSTGSTVSSPSWSCGFVTGGDVWYTYTATDCGDLTIDTNNSTFDTVLEVWDACGGNVLGCNDDINGSANRQSEVILPGVLLGETFLIRVGGFSTATGLLDVNVTLTPTTLPDECATAEVIALGVNGPYNNTCATDSPESWGCGFGPSGDLWFSFTAACDAPHTFRTCGSAFDTRIELFDGACGALNSLGCNDDDCGLQSSITATLTDGVTYYVRVGGYNGATGEFTVEALPGNGGGSIVNSVASLCTVAGLELDVTGTPAIGSTVTATMNGATGLAFMKMDLVGPSPLLAPTCPCEVLGFAGWNFQSTMSLTVPCNVAFVGLPVYVQGADLLGSPAACNVSGVDTAFTDTWLITID
ncbi:MAG: hypothetical protein NXI31_09600 [bacterium]|nr:hypothetical protein [bacterium]